MIAHWSCLCPREKERLIIQKMSLRKEELTYKISKIHLVLMFTAVEMTIKDNMIEIKNNALKITILRQCTAKR